jgi:hypothetical protein
MNLLAVIKSQPDLPTGLGSLPLPFQQILLLLSSDLVRVLRHRHRIGSVHILPQFFGAQQSLDVVCPLTPVGVIQSREEVFDFRHGDGDGVDVMMVWCQANVWGVSGC